MHYFPIEYDEPLFRPPSEADSLILQITLGCSWNKCAFCEMYTTKKFTVRAKKDVFEEINNIAAVVPSINKVFLADGNPLVISTPRLLTVLKKLKDNFPRLRRVSTYALPADINRKTIDELKELREAGLNLLYIGVESGDNEVLFSINKNETFESTETALLKAKEAGLKTSVILINGLGGKRLSQQHAINSARLLNSVQPEYASTLVLTYYRGIDRFKERYKGDFISLNLKELFQEMELFIQHTELEKTIFRSNHASNFLVLSGVLGKDKNNFLTTIKEALDNPILPLIDSHQRSISM